MKILVVDDEFLIREVIKEYCSNEGYEVIEASDGLDALNKLSEDIDLIVLDMNQVMNLKTRSMRR